MVGVCMTVLSISRVGLSIRAHLLLDKLLALDALIFLASAVFSFISMRLRSDGAHLERRAEVVFLLGLTLLAMVAVGLAFAID